MERNINSRERNGRHSACGREVVVLGCQRAFFRFLDGVCNDRANLDLDLGCKKKSRSSFGAEHTKKRLCWTRNKHKTQSITAQRLASCSSKNNKTRTISSHGTTTQEHKMIINKTNINAINYNTTDETTKPCLRLAHEQPRSIVFTTTRHPTVQSITACSFFENQSKKHQLLRKWEQTTTTQRASRNEEKRQPIRMDQQVAETESTNRAYICTMNNQETQCSQQREKQ